MTNTYIEIIAEDNKEDVTGLVKHVADRTPGVTVGTKEGGSIKMSGNVKIQMSDGAIKFG